MDKRYFTPLITRIQNKSALWVQNPQTRVQYSAALYSTVPFGQCEEVWWVPNVKWLEKNKKCPSEDTCSVQEGAMGKKEGWWLLNKCFYSACLQSTCEHHCCGAFIHAKFSIVLSSICWHEQRENSCEFCFFTFCAQTPEIQWSKV